MSSSLPPTGWSPPLAVQLRKPILLEGSPGVGKTSLIAAMAKAVGERPNPGGGMPMPASCFLPFLAYGGQAPPISTSAFYTDWSVCCVPEALRSSPAAAAGAELVRINLSEQTDMMDLLGADLPVAGGAPGEFAW